MYKVFFFIGALAGVPLTALLLCSWAGICKRIWPPPSPTSWQSRVFWPLFRILNLSAFATAVAGAPGFFGLPQGVRLAGLVMFLGAGSLYLYALLALGHANTYCERDGLVTHGIYRWTRNPQYASIIPVYGGLALLADNAPTISLCLALIAVYVLMALNEEPWLKSTYGAAYVRYCRRVPRFFNWHRAMVLALSMLRHLDRHATARLFGQTRTWQAIGSSGRKRL
jgi:protein-S-isoprenylcysteine O-methyltransferase Ste14